MLPYHFWNFIQLILIRKIENMRIILFKCVTEKFWIWNLKINYLFPPVQFSALCCVFISGIASSSNLISKHKLILNYTILPNVILRTKWPSLCFTSLFSRVTWYRGNKIKKNHTWDQSKSSLFLDCGLWYLSHWKMLLILLHEAFNFHVWWKVKMLHAEIL